MTEKKSTSGFKLILLWSLGLLIALAIFGVLFRAVFPLERNLDESEYMEKVFLEYETEFYINHDPGIEPLGVFEGGTILFVVESRDDWNLVRPLPMSKPDSVWVSSNTFISYNQENFRQWLIDEERRRHQSN